MGLPEGSRSASVTFSLILTDFKTDTSANIIVTYNSGGDPSFGAADANRIIAVGMFRRIDSNIAPTGVVIGGVVATQASGAFVASGGVMQSDIWYAPVPTGTSGTVVVTWDATAGAFSDSGIAVFRIITATPAPTIAKNVASANEVCALPSYTVPAGGASMNVFAERNDTSDIAWTNAVRDFFTTVGNRGWSAASVTSAGAVSVTATATVAVGQESVASAAAWGP